MNAITVYMISELLDEALSALALARSVVSRRICAAGLAYERVAAVRASAYTLLLWLIAFGMYRRGWFWRV